MSLTMSRAVVDHGRMLDVLGIEIEVLFETAAEPSANPAAAVPGCPGLTLGGVVEHVAGRFEEIRGWVRSGHRPEPVRRGTLPADPAAALDRARRAGRLLRDELDRHEPGHACATWWPEDRTHGFWRRRAMHEAVVHRVDVQGASGRPVDPIDDAVAVDGIDEVLRLWFGYRLGRLGMSSPQAGSVGVSTADRHWLVQFDRGRCAAREATAGESVRADATVTGDPQRVYLWAWGRLPDQAVRIDGNLDSSAQLWALLRPATQ